MNIIKKMIAFSLALVVICPFTSIVFAENIDVSRIIEAWSPSDNFYKELPNGEPQKDSNIFNIMLLGTDEKLANTSDPGRSDCTMLLSLNKKTGVIKLISFERGIEVPVPSKLTATGNTYDLLTHAYHWGGVELMKKLLRDCFLIDIDAYAQVDIFEFATVIDIIGGIDVTLSEKEASHMNSGVDTRTENVMVEGLNHLNGHDAMIYCRLRSPDDDWQRQVRQRTAVKAAADKISDLSIKEMLSLADTLLDVVNNDVSKLTIASLVVHASKFLKSDFEQLQVPEKNRTGNYIECDFIEEAERIHNFIYGE